MKTKKGLSEIANNIIVILLVLVVVGLAWVFMPNIEEPHYKLYKEVCEDLGKHCDKKCINFCNGIWQEAIEKENYNWNYTKCYEYNNCCEDSCEQVEVDELLWWHENLTHDINKYAKIQGWEAIDKKDLSINWLSENCECVDWDWKGKSCLKGYEPYENPQGMIFCNAPYKDSACSKYKYGDYIIEIK